MELNECYAATTSDIPLEANECYGTAAPDGTPTIPVRSNECYAATTSDMPTSVTVLQPLMGYPPFQYDPTNAMV